MTRNTLKMALAFCLAAGIAYASGNNKNVTNPPPAINAKMTSVTNTDGTCTYTVQGSANPAYKGFGGSVDLVCLDSFCATEGGQCTPSKVGGTVRSCEDDSDKSCFTGIDPCTGQFSFSFSVAQNTDGSCSQASQNSVCFFVVHVGTPDKQLCNGTVVLDNPDPTGSAPCSGSYCQISP